MDKLLLLHKLIKYLLFSYLMQIKMIIMLLVFFEIANQIDKSDEMPGNICAARQHGSSLLRSPRLFPAPPPPTAAAHPPHGWQIRCSSRPRPGCCARRPVLTPSSRQGRVKSGRGPHGTRLADPMPHAAPRRSTRRRAV